MAHKILAITDETHTCECCGKTNLKRVVVIEKADGQIVRYGTTCAANAMLVTKSTGNWLVELKAFADKWLSKYDAQTVISGLWEKKGATARVQDGDIQVYVDRGTWVTIS